MINILYVSIITRIGGGEKSLLIVLKNLDRQKYRPFLICYLDGPLVEIAKELGMEVKIFRYDSLLSNFSVIGNIIKFIKANNIQLMHVNSLDLRAGIAGWLAGIPFLGHLRVIFPFTWRDRLFVRISRKVVAVSNAVVEEFCKNDKKLGKKFNVIPNAVELPDNVNVAPLKKQFGLPEDCKLIGSVGRIDPWKGFEYFLEAASLVKKEFPKSFFFIAGEADQGNPEQKKYEDELKKLVSELRMEKYVFFLGFIKDIFNIMAAFDILVIPSIEIRKNSGTLAEGFGRVAIEGMALGIPVIASATGGLKDIIENEKSGMLVSPNNSQAIAQAALSLLKDNIKSDSIKKEAFKRVKLFYTMPAHLRSIENIYSEILNL